MNETDKSAGPLQRIVGRHTPGPWKWSRGVGEWELVGANADRVLFRWEDAAGLRNATVNGDSLKPADAALIEAAPDLLAVLQELRECADYWSEYFVPIGLVEQMDAALAKALGVPPNQ